MRELFAHYLNPVFVATILETGDILQDALDAGFATVVGATASSPEASACHERFKVNEHVKIYDGQAESILMMAIENYNLEMTFCLDSRSIQVPALIHELSTIRHHRIKTHTLLVKNIHLLETAEAANLTDYQVRMAIREINPLYRFVTVYDQNVLAATIP